MMIIPDIDTYLNGVLDGDRTILAKAITLIESNSPNHTRIAQELLKELQKNSGKSHRIGITGAPGVGKSTFIESLGSSLCDKGHRVAVLAIDPSSSLSRGSILGDKTRMEQLSRHKNSFIRPSPSAGSLGGVARKTRETIIICEAAGFDTIFVETVGVGQSETKVRSMVDLFILLLLPGAGDELQGIKKGSVELSDMVVVNKRESEKSDLARITREDYKNALHLLQPYTKDWETKALICSALSGNGIQDVWKEAQEYFNHIEKEGIFRKRRLNQMLDWFHAMIEDELKGRFYGNPEIEGLHKRFSKEITSGGIMPYAAVQKLMEKFFGS